MNIDKTRLRGLLKAEAKLTALENGGVDNWVNYEDSLEDFDEDDISMEDYE